MVGKHLSLGETLVAFVRDLPVYALGIVVVALFIGVVDGDWSSLPFVTGFVVALAPLFWLRAGTSQRGPRAHPQALLLAIGWLGLCIAALLLLG